MQQNDRTFQFISDPTHKENLSGRVTAACLNCRRKKIRCSGEAQCRQCAEKGIHCDGPPSRKRPKRDHPAPSSQSTTVEPTDSKATSAADPSHDTKSQTSSLAHEDSGYASLRRKSVASNTPSTTTSPGRGPEQRTGDPRAANNPTRIRRPPEQSATAALPGERSNTAIAAPPPSDAAYDSGFNRYGPSTVSPAPPALINASERSLGSPALQSMGTLPGYDMGSMQSYPHGQTYLPLYTGQGSSTFTESTAQQQTANWWADQQDEQRSPSQLVQAAEVLEQQAQSLRRLAFEGHGNEMSPRGQQQDLPVFGNVGSHAEVPMPGYDGMQRGAPYQFDQNAFLRSNETLRGGPTMEAGGFAEWWGQNTQREPARQSEAAGSTSSHNSGADSGRMRMQRAFQDQLAYEANADADPADGRGSRRHRQR